MRSDLGNLLKALGRLEDAKVFGYITKQLNLCLIPNIWIFKLWREITASL